MTKEHEGLSTVELFVTKMCPGYDAFMRIDHQTFRIGYTAESKVGAKWIVSQAKIALLRSGVRRIVIKKKDGGHG